MFRQPVEIAGQFKLQRRMTRGDQIVIDVEPWSADVTLRAAPGADH